MRKSKRNIRRINSKILLVVFFIAMLFFSTSYALLHEELTLSGTVDIYIENEGNNLTVTNFNGSVDSVPITSFFGIVINGYRVVGITIKNTLHRTINDWTIEFTSSNRNLSTTRPTNNKLSEYLNSENAYDTASISNGTVTVKGSDTLAPGESKTVYVFFTYNSLNNNFNFGTPTAYTSEASPRRSAKANFSKNVSIETNKLDEYSSNNCTIYTYYDTRQISGNMVDTALHVFIVNKSSSPISNVQFDLSYNDTNLSSLTSDSISILSSSSTGSSLLCTDTIEGNSCKGYIVNGLKTTDGFHGMTISNLTFANGASAPVITHNEEENEENEKIIEAPTEPEEVEHTNTTDVSSEEIIVSNEVINEKTNEITNEIIENTVSESISDSTVENTYE